MLDFNDIWTYIISLKDGEIYEIRLITFSEGEIVIKDKDLIKDFVEKQRIIQ